MRKSLFVTCCVNSVTCGLQHAACWRGASGGKRGSLMFESRGTGTPSRHQQDHTYMLSCVVMKVCWTFSKLSSVSWEFWMKVKFSSSISVKIDSSCWGSVKYNSGSWNGRHMVMSFCPPLASFPLNYMEVGLHQPWLFEYSPMQGGS